MDVASVARLATPDAVAGWVLAQVPFLAVDAGAALFEQAAARFPPATWCAFLLDGEIERWPKEVAARAVARVLAVDELVVRWICPRSSASIRGGSHPDRHVTSCIRRDRWTPR